MLGLNRKGSSQVLVISDTEAGYYVWKKGDLQHRLELDHTRKDMAQLSHELVANRKLPLTIITDYAEESFRNETSVHLGYRDRKALLERRLQYAFRATPYRSARIVGREPSGLRQDQVLLCGLTRPELIQPWVDLANEYEIAVQAVTSLSFLIETYTSIHYRQRAGELLVTTLESDLRLRQTFLKNGRMLFSRVTTLNAEAHDTLIEEIKQETLQVHKYLSRIRLLSFDDHLLMQFYADQDDIGRDLVFAPSDKIDVERITTSRTDLQGNDEGQRNVVCHFLESVLGRGRLENIYAPPKARRYHLLRTTSSWLNRAAISLIALTLLYKAPVALSIYDKSLQEERNLQRAEPYEFQYNVLRGRFPETPIPSGPMELVVETLESIKAQSPDPVYLTDMLTAALARSPELDILKLEWTVEPVPPETSAPVVRRAVLPEAFQNALLDNNTRLRVVIDGLAYSTGSYSDAQNQVLEFAYALDAIPGVSVTPLRMPTDVRLDVSIATTVGIDDLEAPFTLELIVEDPQ